MDGRVSDPVRRADHHLTVSVTDVLRVARAQIGTTEDPPGSNRQKYGLAAGQNGVAWCAQACWWVWREAGLDVLPRTASVWAMWDHAFRRGWVVDRPRVGDIPVYDFPRGTRWDHIGIVVTSVSGHTFKAIEGNTSRDDRGSQSGGGGVHERDRVLQQTIGFIRPPVEDDMPLTNEEIEAVARRARDMTLGAEYGPKDDRRTLGEILGETWAFSARAARASEATSAAASTGGIDPGIVAQQIVDRLGHGLAGAVAAELARRLGG